MNLVFVQSSWLWLLLVVPLFWFLPRRASHWKHAAIRSTVAILLMLALARPGLLTDLDNIDGAAAVGTAVTGIATSPVNLANKRYTSTTETTGGSTIDITEIIKVDGPKTGRLAWEELTP